MDSLVFNLWYLVAGALLVVMALGGSVLKRLPLTTSILYLAVGFALGQHGAGLIDIDPLAQSGLLERLTEVAVIISLFTAGLKLRAPLSRPRWFIPVRLAFLSMTLTVGLITLVGVAVMGLPLGVAVLLGAILAPTDPVLASDVQLEHPFDRDKLKFGLTGEAGLNDGSAFPFVMLGLGLMGLHDMGDFGWRWFAVDVVWSTLGGLGVGGLLGTMVGRLVVYLRKNHREALGLDDFLALGLIALSYGVALMAHTYGFLAVFAAGVALRRIEMLSSGDRPPEEVMAVTRAVEQEEIATDPEKAPAYMAEAVLGFNEQLERIGEVGVVVLVGGLLTWDLLPVEAVWFVPLLFLVIRPISVEVGLVGSSVAPLQRRLISWFGIRGIGSIYYLMYAIHNGVPAPASQQLLSLVLTVVTVSVVVHGLSVTPLMELYGRLMSRRA